MCIGSGVEYLDLANDVYLFMYNLNKNKLLKILYDGAMKAYIFFVCKYHFKEHNRKDYQNRNRSVTTYDIEVPIDDVDIFSEKFSLLSDDELKFICILAECNSLYDVHLKYGLPRRYCDKMLLTIKHKLV